MIWSCIIGGLIGFIAGKITKKAGSMGIIARIIAGLIGSSVGQAIFGTWGPSLAGMALIPSVLGFFMTFALSIFFDFILFLYFLKIKNIDFKLTINYQETFVFSLKIMALIFLTSLLYVLVLKEKAVD